MYLAQVKGVPRIGGHENHTGWSNKRVCDHEGLSNYDISLKDAKTPFPGTPLPWPLSACTDRTLKVHMHNIHVHVEFICSVYVCISLSLYIYIYIYICIIGWFYCHFNNLHFKI